MMGLPSHPKRKQSETRWLAHAAGKLIERLRQEGIGSAFNLVRANILHFRWHRRDSNFDRQYCVKTSGYILPNDLDVPREKSNLSSEYEPSSEKVLRFMFDHLPVNLKGFTFIDYGSGMGRVLLIASDYPFNQVIGVEFSPGLHEIAEANIKRYRGKSRKCFNTVSVLMDAERFEIPREPCVIYLFDPFNKEIVEKVAANLERSYLEHPRQIIVIYYAPVHRQVFDNAAFLEEVNAITLPKDRSALKQYKVALYKTVA